MTETCSRVTGTLSRVTGILSRVTGTLSRVTGILSRVTDLRPHRDAFEAIVRTPRGRATPASKDHAIQPVATGLLRPTARICARAIATRSHALDARELPAERCAHTARTN